jgi:hypothetical protein
MKRHNNIVFPQALKLYVLGLLMLCGLGAMAQARFYAQAPKTIPLNQAFNLTYVIENGQGTGLQLPDISEFQLLGGPSVSNSYSFVNGQSSQSVSYSYTLRAKKEGTFKLGKGSIKIAGVTAESNELSIQVTAAVQQQQQQTRRSNNPFGGWDPFGDDPFGDNPPQQEVNMDDLRKQIKDDAFLRVNIAKGNVYKGELLTVSYKLYFNRPMGGLNLKKAPSFEGFWSQEVELDPKRQPTTEVVNGKQYRTIEVLKYNLYPQRSGNLPLTPVEMDAVVQVVVQRKPRSAFDAFFGSNQAVNVPVVLQSNAASISAKELPEAGKPTDFTGAVGKYNFETNLSGTETKTDEPLTYSIKVSGSGNLKFIDAPKLNLPPDFEVYDPKIKENISNSALGLSGSKQYDYLFIPRQPGEYKLPAQAFSYFDPATAKYNTINTKEYTIKVTGAPSQAASTGTTTAKQNVAELDKDIRYIKTKTDLAESGSSPYSFGYTVAYLSPFLLLGGLVMLRKRNETLAGDVIGTKRRRATKVAQQRLSNAKKLLAANDKTGFYNEVSRAMWGYLGDKLNIDMAGLNKDNIQEQLTDRQVSAETIEKMKGLLSTCEQALYSPIGSGNEMNQNYDAAINLVADLEGEIKLA